MALFQKPMYGVAQFVQLVEAGELTPEVYQERMSQFRKTFPERFGVDLEHRVKDALSRLWPKAEMKVPSGEDGTGSFAPFTFRKLLPGKGTLKPHCGHYFTHEFPNFYQRLSHFTSNECQFSFFILLKEAEGGGELTLYDMLWEDAKKRPSDEVLVTEKGKTIDLNNPRQIARQPIRPKAGDMITFNGGDIWHRVETVKGTKTRLTLGGFISFSRNSDSMWMWS